MITIGRRNNNNGGVYIQEFNHYIIQLRVMDGKTKLVVNSLVNQSR
jgi:hypothetical protein